MGNTTNYFSEMEIKELNLLVDDILTINHREILLDAGNGNKKKGDYQL